jgi:hypothetical protein
VDQFTEDAGLLQARIAFHQRWLDHHTREFQVTGYAFHVEGARLAQRELEELRRLAANATLRLCESQVCTVAVENQNLEGHQLGQVAMDPPQTRIRQSYGA